jgi:hypothetical protein
MFFVSGPPHSTSVKATARILVPEFGGLWRLRPMAPPFAEGMRGSRAISKGDFRRHFDAEK